MCTMYIVNSFVDCVVAAAATADTAVAANAFISVMHTRTHFHYGFVLGTKFFDQIAFSFVLSRVRKSFFSMCLSLSLPFTFRLSVHSVRRGKEMHGYTQNGSVKFEMNRSVQIKMLNGMADSRCGNQTYKWIQRFIVLYTRRCMLYVM